MVRDRPRDYPRDAQCPLLDEAATKKRTGKDPDWTAGARIAEKDGIYYIADIHSGVEPLPAWSGCTDCCHRWAQRENLHGTRTGILGR